MRLFCCFLSVLAVLLTGCRPGQAQPTIDFPTVEATFTVPVPPTLTNVPTLSPTTAPTPTTVPEGVIHVDTLEQEVYPFVENGNCSLAEAIFAANAAQAKDGCAAGGADESVIELMPGEYQFTERDQTPPQVEWVVSTLSIGDALPLIFRPLTIRGNGAVLRRVDSAEPFRFFEVLFGSLTLQDLTLQGGDVLDDWGGAIYANNVSLILDHVQFLENRADNGGGLYLTFSGLNLTDTVFTGNYASFAGGGAYLDGSQVTLISATFSDNLADGPGGALYAEGVRLNIEDSLFLHNQTTGTRGGGLYLGHVSLTVNRSQFYQNESDWFGGAISLNNPIMEGIDPSEGDPIDEIATGSSDVSSLLTSIPNFEATLQAHPSGSFQELVETAEIHDSCFANNVTHNDDPNWTSAIVGMSAAENNFWGDPSGPSGMGPGTGDNIGKRITFEPFQVARPEYCDLILSEQQ